MIQEIINFTNEISASNPGLFLLNKKPNEGLHVFIELDEDGGWKNAHPEREVDYTFYDGKSDLTPLLSEFMKYEDCGKRVGTTMNKALDKKKQVFSCSPYIVNFKKQSFVNAKIDGVGYEKITNLFPFYFENARSTCLDITDESSIQRSKAFEQVCIDVLRNIDSFVIPQLLKDGSEVNKSAFEPMKDGFYVSLYLKNIPLEKYKDAHERYLKQKLFNTNDYNSTGKDKEITDDTFGISSFLNGLNSKKTFLEHKTAFMYKGISGRINVNDAVALNNFDLLLSNKALPNPLPIFVDKEEFSTNEKIITLFNQSGDIRLTYSQVLKEIFAQKQDLKLSNYYLLNMIKGEVKDFDFVSLFRYHMKKAPHACEILNLFEVKKGKELEQTIPIDTIFKFENTIVVSIFNNSLVKLKNDSMSVNYFGDIDPTYVSGGDLVYQMILKYRQAFYDYIYKSKENAITCLMFDDIIYNSLLADLREDEFKDGKYHTRGTNIRRKLNIWFSLYNYFSTTNKRINMAAEMISLKERVKNIGSSDAEKISNDREFAYSVGQIVYFLLNKSETSDRTHAILEPYLQKTDVEQLRITIARTFDTYKHAIPFYKKHRKYEFDKLMSEVMEYVPTERNMKNLLPLILAGYFAKSIFIKETEIAEENN